MKEVWGFVCGRGSRWRVLASRAILRRSIVVSLRKITRHESVPPLMRTTFVSSVALFTKFPRLRKIAQERWFRLPITGEVRIIGARSLSAWRELSEDGARQASRSTVDSSRLRTITILPDCAIRAVAGRIFCALRLRMETV